MVPSPAGCIVGIARRPGPRAPMEAIALGIVTCERGLDGDHKGAKFPRRQITLLSAESWAEAIATLTDLAGPVPLPWTTRRANILTEGIALPRGRGSLIRIGPVLLEVTAQTFPCRRMAEAHLGLMKALAPDWRGGVTARVITGGSIRLGDRIEVAQAVHERPVRLPG